MEKNKVIKNIVFEDQIYDIPRDEIYANEKWNCRGSITATDVLQLAISIATNGQEQPGQLRLPYLDEDTKGKPYVLIAGFRRLRACFVKDIPTYRGIFKKDISPVDAMALNFSENNDRKNLNLLQEAKVFQRFVDAGLNQYQIMEALGITRGYLQPRLSLLKLSTDIQEYAAAGLIGCMNIRDLYSFTDPVERSAAAKQYVDNKKIGVKGIGIAIPKKSKLKKEEMRMRRTPKQATDFLKHLFYQKIPMGFYSRILAWSVGRVKDVEIFEDITAYAESPMNSEEIINFINETHQIVKEDVYIDPGEVGESLLKHLSNFKGVIYEKPENGFPKME